MCASVSKMSEAYLEPVQGLKMVLYVEQGNDIKLLTFFFGRKLHHICLTRF